MALSSGSERDPVRIEAQVVIEKLMAGEVEHGASALYAGLRLSQRTLLHRTVSRIRETGVLWCCSADQKGNSGLNPGSPDKSLIGESLS